MCPRRLRFVDKQQGRVSLCVSDANSIEANSTCLADVSYGQGLFATSAACLSFDKETGVYQVVQTDKVQLVLTCEHGGTSGNCVVQYDNEWSCGCKTADGGWVVILLICVGVCCCAGFALRQWRRNRLRKQRMRANLAGAALVSGYGDDSSTYAAPPPAMPGQPAPQWGAMPPPSQQQQQQQQPGFNNTYSNPYGQPPQQQPPPQQQHWQASAPPLDQPQQQYPPQGGFQSYQPVPNQPPYQ
eukprot:TRINITY_DN66434_c12_g1_i5.p2 TRINITY_DN66434_c12_g1~~TRINITY_DN66434_c12_g1_i5.p2  ORF type:complete len:242 (-),score=96.59 TRINITY_DN66434_c12_g1_i5:69-794(-)